MTTDTGCLNNIKNTTIRFETIITVRGNADTK